MALSISKAVEQIKSDVAAAIPGDVIRSIGRQLGYVRRERSLDPVTTVHALVRQVLKGAGLMDVEMRVCWCCRHPRPPRVDEAGGLYHALNRGNARGKDYPRG
jgi:hypothetical protein